MNLIPAVFILLLIAAIGAIGIIVGLFLLQAFGLYRLAKNRGLNNPWFAFIPLLNRYLLGELTGNTMWGVEGSKWILMGAPLVLMLLTLTIILSIIAIPLAIAYIVYYYMVLFRLYKIYIPERADLYTILSILFNFTVCIWIFLIRNNEPHLNELKPDILSNESENSTVSDTIKTEPVLPENSEEIDYFEIKKNIDDINQSAKEIKPDNPFKTISKEN